VGSKVELFEATRRDHRREELSIRQHCPATGPLPQDPASTGVGPAARVRRRNGPPKMDRAGPLVQEMLGQDLDAVSAAPQRPRGAGPRWPRTHPRPPRLTPVDFVKMLGPTCGHEVWRPLSGWTNVRPRRSGAGSNYPTTCDFKCGAGFPADHTPNQGGARSQSHGGPPQVDTLTCAVVCL
jgi:hypothetical protein